MQKGQRRDSIGSTVASTMPDSQQSVDSQCSFSSQSDAPFSLVQPIDESNLPEDVATLLNDTAAYGRSELQIRCCPPPDPQVYKNMSPDDMLSCIIYRDRFIGCLKQELREAIPGEGYFLFIVIKMETDNFT